MEIFFTSEVDTAEQKPNVCSELSLLHPYTLDDRNRLKYECSGLRKFPKIFTWSTSTCEIFFQDPKRHLCKQSTQFVVRIWSLYIHYIIHANQGTVQRLPETKSTKLMIAKVKIHYAGLQN